MYVGTPIVVSSLGVTGLAPQGGAKVVDHPVCSIVIIGICCVKMVLVQ